MRIFTRANKGAKQLFIILLALMLVATQLIVAGIQEVSADPVYTELISKSSTGEESNMGISGEPRISHNGRYILYPSFSTNLGGERAGDEGLYLYDRETGITNLVSVDSDGNQALGEHIFGFALSGDGRHVAFGSNPLAGQTGGGNKTKIYVRNLDTQTTSLVSLNNSGEPLLLGAPYISLSYDGNVIAFVNGGTGSHHNIFIRDLTSSTLSILPPQPAQRLWLSDDGNRLLYNGSNSGIPMLYDRTTGIAQVAQYESDGSPTAIDDSYPVALSGNGRYAFSATYRCMGEPNQSASGCLLRTNLDTHTTQELPGIDPVWYISTSTDGSLVVYGGGNYGICDDSSNCIDFYPPIYLYNVSNNTTEQVSETPINTEVGSILISGNGKVVTFFTGAANFGVTVGQQILALSLSDSNSSTEQTVLYPSADTYVRSGNSNRNHGADTEMNIQSSGNNRGLVHFDQSAISGAVGSSTVLSATLKLTITDNGNNWGTTGRTLDIHRLLSNWVEGNGTANNRGSGNGATWDCAIDSLIENQAKNCSGAAVWEMGQPNNPSIHPWFATPAATQTITNGQSGVIEFDVTADVQAFMNGSANNFGWLIKKTNEGQNGQVSFGTKESNFKPELIITYQP